MSQRKGMENRIINEHLNLENLDCVPFKYDDRFLIYSNGLVYCERKEKFKSDSGNGKHSKYRSYTFYRNKKNTKHYVHRLVAEHFLENPHGLRDVHHKDSNVFNNDVSNLEWLSHQENCQMKPLPNPLEKIKVNPMAYINYNKIKDYYIFTYQGSSNPNKEGWNGCQSTSKGSKTLEGAQKHRDNHFAVA